MFLFINSCSILLFVAFAESKDDKSDLTSKDRCRIGAEQKVLPSLDGMVGIGWDNLENKAMPSIFANSFSKCRTTQDGELLVPDQVRVMTVKKMKLTRQAEYYENFKDAFEKNTYSINIGLSFPPEIGQNIGGSFSGRYIKTKQNMANNKNTMFITELDYHAYTLISEMNSEFDPAFKGRLLAINSAFEKNLTEQARYLAEMVIRDYGTHVLSRVKIGARIEASDFLNSSIIKTDNATLQDYSLSFFTGFIKDFIGFDVAGGYGEKDKDKEDLTKIKRISTINSYGGLDVNSLLAQSFDTKHNEKSNLRVENFVPLDVDGMLLYVLVKENPIPEINVDATVDFLKNATTLYFAKNLHPGCMDPSSRNFNYLANFDDENSCENNTFIGTTTFGGFYQKCSKKTQNDYPYACNTVYNRIHPITKEFECPKDYKEIFLYNLVLVFAGSWSDTIMEIEIYWCRADFVDQKQAFLFGGLYSKTENNLVTGEPTCPKHFKPYKFAYDVTICLSRDFNRGQASEVKFGGFFSCLSVEKDCEEGFSRYLIENYRGCDIYYCVRPENFKYKFPEINRLPFEDISALSSMVMAKSRKKPSLQTLESGNTRTTVLVAVFAFLISAISLIVAIVAICRPRKKHYNDIPLTSRRPQCATHNTEDTIL